MADNEYTPTTEDIMRNFTAPPFKINRQRDGETFGSYLSRLSMESMHSQMESEAAARRWLAAHDAQVRAEAKAEALREHAKRLRYWTRDESQNRLRFSVDNAVADLEEEAARIDRTTTETTNGDSDE